MCLCVETNIIQECIIQFLQLTGKCEDYLSTLYFFNVLDMLCYVQVNVCTPLKRGEGVYKRVGQKEETTGFVVTLS